MWWVYVIQSQAKRWDRRGRLRPGFYYVGASTWVPRRIRQHNGEIKGGGRYTSKHRPWVLRAVYGPYRNQSEAMKAERALKHSKRGQKRCHWSPEDSKWCRGAPGTLHPWVTDLTWKPPEDALEQLPPETEPPAVTKDMTDEPNFSSTVLESDALEFLDEVLNAS
jgi:predicted GIY-YIG superfamily endonuclease